jgi:hypothetical protein
LAGGANSEQENHTETDKPESLQPSFDGIIRENLHQMFNQGKQSFPFATFGDETFWGVKLHLHKAIKGAGVRGSRRGHPSTNRARRRPEGRCGRLPESVVQGLKDGTINLDDPAVTLALLKLNSVRIPEVFVSVEGEIKQERQPWAQLPGCLFCCSKARSRADERHGYEAKT